ATGFDLLSSPAEQKRILDGYDVVVANSEFTRQWIRRYWGRDSFVLYPPTDVDRFSPGVKRDQVISVGRFFAGNHNKKHLTMIESFRRLHAGALHDWQYHVVGGYSANESNAAYLAAVEQAAAACSGIHLHVNADFDELR